MNVNLGLQPYNTNDLKEVQPAPSKIAPAIKAIQKDSVSFRGIPDAAAKAAAAIGENLAPKAETFAERFVTNPMFKKFSKFATENPVALEALAAFGICCTLRPMTILAMSTKKDAENNKKAAAHSITSGIVGLVTSVLCYNIFSDAMKKIDEAILNGNGAKYLTEKTEYLKNADNFKALKPFMTYGPKIITAPLLAATTIAIMPFIDKNIVSKIGGKKKTPETEAAKIAETKVISRSIDEETYKLFITNPEVSKLFGGALQDQAPSVGSEVKGGAN